MLFGSCKQKCFKNLSITMFLVVFFFLMPLLAFKEYVYFHTSMTSNILVLVVTVLFLARC